MGYDRDYSPSAALTSWTCCTQDGATKGKQKESGLPDWVMVRYFALMSTFVRMVTPCIFQTYHEKRVEREKKEAKKREKLLEQSSKVVKKMLDTRYVSQLMVYQWRYLMRTYYWSRAPWNSSLLCSLASQTWEELVPVEAQPLLLVMLAVKGNWQPPWLTLTSVWSLMIVEVILKWKEAVGWRNG